MNDEKCNKEISYACEKSANITTTPAPAPICALGWTGFNGHCYQHFSNSNLNSFAANDACNNLDGYLLKIDNNAELDFLITYIKERIGESIFVKHNILDTNLFYRIPLHTTPWGYKKGLVNTVKP